VLRSGMDYSPGCPEAKRTQPASMPAYSQASAPGHWSLAHMHLPPHARQGISGSDAGMVKRYWQPVRAARCNDSPDILRSSGCGRRVSGS
jgi:hypothetical protein